MEKAVQHFAEDLKALRTGRASVAMLDGVIVELYGVPQPLKAVASVSTPDARTLAVAPWILVAGTDFLKRTGHPKTPEDLKQSPCLFVWRANTTPAWRLQAPEGRIDVIQPLTPRLISNDMSTLKRAASAGMGIVALPAYVCKGELHSGELTRVLPGWLAGESTFTALLPHRRGLLPAVKIFVDYLARYLPNTVSRVLA